MITKRYMPCTVCGTRMHRSAHSNPPELARCRPCRGYGQPRQPKPTWRPQVLACPICHGDFTQNQRNQKYCNAECRAKRHGKKALRAADAEERGYGKAHRYARVQWKPVVEAGGVDCCLCGDPIEPGTPWHLDHTEDRQGYRGVAHAVCNLRDGAKRTPRRGWLVEPSEHTCETCSATFLSKWPVQKYCSVECRPKYERKTPRKKQPRNYSPLHFAHCEGCGDLFASQHARRFCTRACNHRALRALHASTRQPKQHPCPDCGTSIAWPRQKCEPCAWAANRAAKARTRKRWKTNRRARLAA